MLQKTDIFKRIMWFGFKSDNNWYPAPVERVKEILELNSRGVVVESLTVEEKAEQQKKVELVAQLEGNLERLDEKFKPKKKKKKKPKRDGVPVLAAVATEQKPAEARPPHPRSENRPVAKAGMGNANVPGNGPKDGNVQKRRNNKRPNRDNRPPRNEGRPDKPANS